jgi:hypothetical protein
MYEGKLLRISFDWLEMAKKELQSSFLHAISSYELYKYALSLEDRIIRLSYVSQEENYYIVQINNLKHKYNLIAYNMESSYTDPYYKLTNFLTSIGYDDSTVFAYNYDVSTSGYSCPRCENGFLSKWPGYKICSRCGFPGMKIKIEEDK